MAQKTSFFKSMCVLMIMVACCSTVFAQGRDMPFGKDVKYNVYFQVSDIGLTVLSRVMICDIFSINNNDFLVVSDKVTAGIPDPERTSYIRMDSIRSIVPSVLPRLELFDQDLGQ